MTEEAISRSEAKGTLTYGLDPVGNRQALASTVTGDQPAVGELQCE